ncbi:MAG TPA: hypothetical protein VLA04_04370 [Verrucomicrobiae bacterium]|nr:hypothetical protein [Verrucomicrobiae bacterium]
MNNKLLSPTQLLRRPASVLAGLGALSLTSLDRTFLKDTVADFYVQLEARKDERIPPAEKPRLLQTVVRAAAKLYKESDALEWEEIITNFLIAQVGSCAELEALLEKHAHGWKLHAYECLSGNCPEPMHYAIVTTAERETREDTMRAAREAMEQGGLHLMGGRMVVLGGIGGLMDALRGGIRIPEGGDAEEPVPPNES